MWCGVWFVKCYLACEVQADHQGSEQDSPPPPLAPHAPLNHPPLPPPPPQVLPLPSHNSSPSQPWTHHPPILGHHIPTTYITPHYLSHNFPFLTLSSSSLSLLPTSLKAPVSTSSVSSSTVSRPQGQGHLSPVSCLLPAKSLPCLLSSPRPHCLHLSAVQSSGIVRSKVLCFAIM